MVQGERGGLTDLATISPQCAAPVLEARCSFGVLTHAIHHEARPAMTLLYIVLATLAGGRGDLPGGGEPGSGQTRERVVVALSGGPEGETLVRRAARIAARSGGDLLAVHAARPALERARDVPRPSQRSRPARRSSSC